MDFTLIFLMLFGIALLVFGGDIFVDGACAIARRFGLSEFIIGATVVSIGTTLPEVTVSANSAINGAGEIAYGNAIGSIICNAALIAGLCILIRPIKIAKESIVLPSAFFFSTALLYVVISYFFGEFSRIIGVILLLIFLGYIAFNLYSVRKQIPSGKMMERVVEKGEKLPLFKEILAEIKGERTSIPREIIMLVLGAVAIAFGADFLVKGTIDAANVLGIPQTVISLTVVALGTSLPELITAITSLVKGHSSLSLGNIVGANLLNLILVNGVSVLINPYSVPTTSTLFNQNTALVLDIPIMLITMAILTIPAIFKERLTRIQGASLLTLYVAFCIVQFFFCLPAT